jgi:hypothetical protein
MAYDAIVHGAKGILYWGAQYTDSDAFLDSILAVTSELAALQPFLVQPDMAEVRCNANSEHERPGRGVRVMARRAEEDLLVVLVNEDRRAYPKVSVSGLPDVESRELGLLYSDETARVRKGGFATPMEEYSVRVYATGRKWETTRRTGREYDR